MMTLHELLILFAGFGLGVYSWELANRRSWREVVRLADRAIDLCRAVLEGDEYALTEYGKGVAERQPGAKEAT